MTVRIALAQVEPATRDVAANLATFDDAMERAAADGVSDPHQLQQILRRVVGKWVNDTYRRRPMIVPHVLEV